MSYFAVLGAGSWGATIAQHLVTLDHQVNLWSKFDHEVELLRTAKTHPFIEDLSLDKKIQLTFSGGVELRSNNKDSHDTLVNADKLLYKAKNSGRNKILFWDKKEL